MPSYIILHCTAPQPEVLVRSSRLAGEGPRHVSRRTLGAEPERLSDVGPENAALFQAVEG